MEKWYLEEDTTDFFIFLFVVVVFLWTVLLMAINLAKGDDGLPIVFLGSYVLNAAVSYVLWIIGIFLLITFFQWIFDALNKRAKTRKEEEGV